MNFKRKLCLLLSFLSILTCITIEVSAASKWISNDENTDYTIKEEINKVSASKGQSATITWKLDRFLLDMLSHEKYPDNRNITYSIINRIDDDNQFNVLKNFYSGIGCQTSDDNLVNYFTNRLIETSTKEYYKQQHGIDADFKCVNPNNPDYKEVIATYTVTGESNIKNLGHGQGDSTANITKHYQTTIFTNADLKTQNLTLDADDGRLIISGTMARDNDAWNITYIGIRHVALIVSAVAFLCCALAFVISFTQLGLNAQNPHERAKMIRGIIWTGIGTAGLGAVTIFFAMSYTFLH